MTDCPDESLFRAYYEGDLDESEAESLERHLATCPTCAQTMDKLRRGDLSARIIRAAIRPVGPPGGMGIEAASGIRPADGSASRADEPDTEANLWDIPDYERVCLCGEGAYGTVWAVRDRVGMYRALKVIDLRPIRAARRGCREMTALETYCRHVERHPNLIEIHHVGLRGPLLYYVMELADDESTRQPVRDELPANYRPLSLQQLLRDRPIAADAAIEVALRLLRGLSHLHRANLAHCDIKPANIVFVNREPKLADIGMVTRELGPEAGTPDYMPPDRRMDCTADVYAMGKVLHEMLCGGRHYAVPELPELVLAQSATWELPAVARCIARACERRAENRYQSADRMLEDIEMRRQLPLEALLPAPPPADDPTGRPRRINWTPVLIAAVHVLPWVLAALFAILLVLRHW